MPGAPGAFSTSESGVTVKASYYLGEHVDDNADMMMMTEKEFTDGTVLKKLSDYGWMYEKRNWSEDASHYPTSYHAEADVQIPDSSNIPKETAVPQQTAVPEKTEVPQQTAVPEKTEAPVEKLEDRDTPLSKGEKVESDGIIFQAKGSNSVVIEKNTNPEVQTVTIPDTIEAGGVKYKVTMLSSGAYAGCKKLKTVSLGKNVKTIGKGCFKNCTKLKKVSFPSNLKTISSGAFQNCRKLKSAALPAGTKAIGEKCFKNCKSMKTFTVGNVKKKKGGLSLGETEDVMYGAAPVVISIAASALENCSSLKQIIINSQVEKIGNAAFRDCTSLSKIIIYSLILKKVGKRALVGVQNCRISVPQKKIKPYNVLFKNKGQGKKVVVAKM